MKKIISVFILLGAVTWMCTAQSYTHQHETLPYVNKKFSIVAHIFSDSLGNYGVTEAAIHSAVKGMNQFFEPISVSFEVCEFRYHPNFEHDTLNGTAERDVITLKYRAEYRINFYFLSKLNGEEAGFAYGGIGGGSSSGIFIEKTAGVSSGVFAHEMGHYCGLLHTFEGNGVELVNGDNCTTAGDGICDTPADPFVPGEEMTDYVEGCRFISPKTDANGEYYNPDLGNVMSYYQCGVCGFTWQQLHKMAGVILANAMGLW